MRLLSQFTALDIIDPLRNRCPAVLKTKTFSGRKWGDTNKWYDARREAGRVYASALAGWHGEMTDELRKELRALRGLCQDIVELRRGDHSGTRLQMEQERLGWEREKTEEEVIAHFERRLKNPEVRDLVCQNWVGPKERERRMREIFGLAAKPSEPADANSDDESNPVKPSQTNSAGQTEGTAGELP
jgi:hypothetical protein